MTASTRWLTDLIRDIPDYPKPGVTGQKLGWTIPKGATIIWRYNVNEIWSLVSSNRQSVVTLADAKVKQPAPVFVSWFAWQPPLFDGRMGAFHCIDICFWFNNTDLMYTHTGGGARPRRLADKMSKSLVQFMKTGDPNGAGLTPWSKYTSAKGETLVLDDAPVMKNDPDREPRRSLPTT